MATCSRCGTSLGEYAHEGLCSSCVALAQADNVPCQRCGMYLPSHELKMFNSRLYCSYCIMDLQDEEARQHKISEQPHAPPAGPPHSAEPSHPFSQRVANAPVPSHAAASPPASYADAAGTSEKAGTSENLEQYKTQGGTCERCGASAQQLYVSKGKKLCKKCSLEEGASGEPAKGFFHAMHEIVSKFLIIKK